jgi:hypothetical protein
MRLAKAALLFNCGVGGGLGSSQCGCEQKPEASLPFTMTTVATF